MIPDQVRALVYLKFTLMRNSWMRGQRLSFAFGALLAVLAVGLAAGLAIGLFVLGLYLPEIANAESGAISSLVLLLIGDGLVLLFLTVWSVSLLVELQRSEVIDFRKMLFLPVPLRLVFLLNFAVSLISMETVFFLLPLCGFTLGLTIGFGPRMLLALPLGIAFYFMLAGWTYYVRGILIFIMENKRRRRTVIVAITMSFALLGQLPMLANFTFMSHFRHRDNARISGDTIVGAIHVANAIVPVGWLPAGVAGLAEGNLWPPLLAFLGLAGLGAGGLTTGYRSTLRHYTGVGRRKRTRAVRQRPKSGALPRRSLMTRKFVFVDDDTSAVAVASFLGYIRHPQVRVQLVFPFAMGAIMLFYFRGMASDSGLAGGAITATLAPVGVAIWPVLSMSHFIFNVFGIDAEGFRTLVLLPTDRTKYLLGKNLALFPITGGVAALFAALCAFILSIPSAQFVLSLGYVVLIYLLYCIFGNFASIYSPFRIRYQGRQSLQSGSWVRALAILAIFPLGALATMLVLIPAGVSFLLQVLTEDLPSWVCTAAGMGTAVLLIVAMALAYRFSIRVAGARLLEREQTILEYLVKDRE